MSSKRRKTPFNSKRGAYVCLSLAVLITASIIFLLPLIKADVMSVNAGGDNNTAVNPDNYIEGFFSALPNITGEVITPPPGGGGPGGGGGPPPALNISLSPTNMTVNLAVNTTTQRTIKVSNLGTGNITLTVTQSNLGNHVLFENTTFTIPAKQSVNLNVIFIALDTPGIFAGTINIGGKQILVNLNVRTQLILFDSNIVVLNNNYNVPQGDQLRSRVTLIPFGDPGRLDVNLLFTIRDYAGKIYLTKSETMMVQNLTTIERDFDTGNLPLGNYVIGLELVYPNGVAPSSAHFEITPKTGLALVEQIIIYLIALILLVLILILIILIWRRSKEDREQKRLGQGPVGGTTETFEENPGEEA